MKAPLFPPASAFVEPKRLPRVLSARDTPIADLMAVPAAWAIVLKELPSIERLLGQLREHLGNFSLLSLAPFGMVNPEANARIDAQLRTLGEFE